MSPQPSDKHLQAAYALAQERYAQLGVDTDQALTRLAQVPLSLHCWQGDDVGGFEHSGESLSGGIAATGNYPGKARTPAELRCDLDKVYSLIPGSHRLALHAMYAETAARYEYMNLVNHEQGEGLSVEEVRAIAKLWNIEQTIF